MFFRIVKCINNNDITKDKSTDQNRQQRSGCQFNPMHVAKEIVDENNYVIGKCTAEIYEGDAAIIETLQIDQKYRWMGLATELLEKIETLSQEKGCSSIHLDTFDVDKKEFYMSHGYEIFGTMENCPKGHCRYYLKKEL